MSKPSAYLLAFSLLGATAIAQKGSQPAFKLSESNTPFAPKPCFDYTRVQEPNSVWWERLESAKIDLQSAVKMARLQDPDPDPETVRAAGARLISGERDYYLIELWRLGTTDSEFVRLAADNGEFLRGEFSGEACFDHGEVTEELAHAGLFEAPVLLEDAIGVAAAKFGRTPHARRITFKAQGQDRRYELEMFSTHPKGKFRRWHMVTPADKHMVRMRIKLDRYAGEPMMGEVATPLDSGLQVHDFIVGDGEIVTADSVVQVHYRLVLLDNQSIFNTKSRAKPVSFKVADAQLDGIRLGLQGMRVGGKRKIVIPPELAFGKQGRAKIPPNAVIVADIGVIGIEDPSEE